MATFAADLIPDTDGRTLGSDDQRWNAKLKDLTVSGVKVLVGTGNPAEANELAGTDAPQGSLFIRIDGDASSTLYVKTGADATAWTAK
jgi:hypothetical protein